MLGKTFYHSLTRKYISLFGNLFNDIYIVRDDNGRARTIQVPIAYSPKEKWLALLSKHPQDQKVGVQLPMIGFEITSLSYDSARAVNASHQINLGTLSKDFKQVTFAPRPFRLGLQLNVVAKSYDDLCQIVEQIIPFFTPDFTIPAKLLPNFDSQNFDIKVRLEGTNIQDTYGDDFMTRRAIICNFDFTMEIFYFGQVSKQGVIKRVQVDLHTAAGSGEIQGTDLEAARTVRIETLPGLTVDGKPTTIKDDSINYLLINSEDDYGFIETTEFFQDGKKYNPVTGQDE